MTINHNGSLLLYKTSQPKSEFYIYNDSLDKDINGYTSDMKEGEREFW